MNRGLSLAKGWGDRTARLSLTLGVALTSRGCQAGRRTPLPEHLGAHSAHSQDLAPSRLSFLAPSASSLLCGHCLASGSLSTPPPQNAVPGGRAACWSRVSRVAHVHPLVLDPRAPRAAAERPNAPPPDPGFRSSASPSGPPWAKAPAVRAQVSQGPRGWEPLSVSVWFGRAPAGQASSAPAYDFWWWSGLD